MTGAGFLSAAELVAVFLGGTCFGIGLLAYLQDRARRRRVQRHRDNRDG